jgi:ParB/RepB/Spo0J family partition protein
MLQIEPPLMRRSAKIRVEDLRVSPFNVRLEADHEGLDALTESIKIVGLQNPLVVRQVPNEPDVYEVIEGSRRLRALKKLGYTNIECRVAEMNDQQALVASIQENMYRGDVTAAELGRAIKMMMNMMPDYWGEKKKRGAVAQNLGWVSRGASGRTRPDVGRVKDAISMSEFQEDLPGIVIKQRTRGDAKKSSIAWSTAKQVRDIVMSPEMLPVLEAKPAEERAGFVQQIANEYQQTPTKLRAEFARRVQSTPERSPDEIRRELDARENRAVVVTFRADAALHQAIDSYAASQNGTRAEAVTKLVRLGLQTADEITRPLNRLMGASFDGNASDNTTD